MRFETKAIHAGQTPDPTTGAIMTPVYLTSTYVQEVPGQHKGYEYSRTHNPTRKAFEQCLASLEGATHGFATASGCAAIHLVLSLLEEGDHVIAADDMYGGTFRLFQKVMVYRGLRFDFADFTSGDEWLRLAQPRTRLVWLETPTNPMLKVIDIERVCREAKKLGLMVAVDNTFMSPYFQNPLSLGADLVVHSTTKYIGGHSDSVGGAVVTHIGHLAEKLHFLSNSIGAIMSPFDAYLNLRSLKTLPIRMKAHNSNAQRISEFLLTQKRVKRVIYPGLPSHPGHAIALKQMRGFGGMITVELDASLDEVKRFLKGLRIFSLAESLGGVESLIEHPAIMTHASLPPERRQELGISDGLLRLSIGIENLDDLVEDLEGALQNLN